VKFRGPSTAYGVRTQIKIQGSRRNLGNDAAMLARLADKLVLGKALDADGITILKSVPVKHFFYLLFFFLSVIIIAQKGLIVKPFFYFFAASASTS